MKIFLIIVVLAATIGGYVYYQGLPNSMDVVVEDKSMIDEEMHAADDAMVDGDDTMMEEGEVMMEEGKVMTFALTAKNFEFSVKEIRVKKGDKVKINFESTDGFHDWVVEGLNAKTARVNTGGKTSVEFVAGEAGEFEFYCSVGNHRQMGMVGKLIVE